jgi:hypothetical protein
MLSSVGLDDRLPLIGTGERGPVSWRERTEFWQALTTRAEQQPLSCAPTANTTARPASASATDRGPPLEIELDDQERRAVGRLLSERKALLIETTEDTTQPDAARRAGLVELSVLESILGKLRLRNVTSTGASAERLGAAEGVGNLSRPT